MDGFVVGNFFVSVLKHLGCPHGCSEGQRGPAAEFLRTQCQNILIKLNRASAKQFKNFLRDYVRHQRLQDVLEFCHAHVGFCIDPTSLLSPLSKLDFFVSVECCFSFTKKKRVDTYDTKGLK